MTEYGRANEGMCLVDERTPATLNESNPRLGRIWVVITRLAKNRTARVGRPGISGRIVWGTATRKGRQRDDVSEEGILESGAEGGRAGVECEWGRAIDDGDGAVCAPYPAPQPASLRRRCRKLADEG